MKKLIILFTCILITGCTSYAELSSLDVIENLGIDYYDEKFHILVSTVSKNENDKAYQTYTSTGKTLEEAIQNIQIQEHKKLYIAHLHLLVLTPNTISSKLEETLEFFLQNNESRNDFSLAISDSITFLEEKQDNIQDTIQIIEESLGTTKTMDFETFIKNILDEELTFLPTIKKEETLEISGITILQNNRIINTLTEEETILFNLLHNNLKQTTILDTKILSNQTFFTYRKDKLTVTIECILTSENKNFKTDLETKIQTMYEQYKDKNIDIFGLLEHIRESNPLLPSNKKTSLLKNLEINFHIETKTDQDNKKEIDLS